VLPVLDGSERSLCADLTPLLSSESIQRACYPRPASWCARLFYELEQAGVEGVCNYRLRRGYPPGILGRGHSSVVLLVRYNRVPSALKIRRTDSRRTSLVEEAMTTLRAAVHGAAPRPYYWSRDAVLMEYARGALLGDLAGSPWHTRAVLAGMDAARALDTAGILHNELVRPWKHVVYNGVHAFIIDYDSAGEGCGNPVKLASGVLSRAPGGLEVLIRYRPLLRRYRVECSRELYEKLRAIVAEALGRGRG